MSLKPEEETLVAAGQIVFDALERLFAKLKRGELAPAHVPTVYTMCARSIFEHFKRATGGEAAFLAALAFVTLCRSREEAEALLARAFEEKDDAETRMGHKVCPAWGRPLRRGVG